MIGVIADDVTGANDVGSMFTKGQYVSDVYNFEQFDFHKEQLKRSAPDALILDTDSRFDDRRTAYEKVFDATTESRRAGAELFYKKTCSVFRGNIGAELDAVLDALGEEFAVVVLGFPKNGRTTKRGIHYVRGRKLEDSEFRNDPMHPMTQSNLVQILQSQTRRKVGSIHFETVKEGVSVLQSEIERVKTKWNYVILDVTEQEDLRTIARALKDVKIFCGSSALAEELPAVLGGNSHRDLQLPEDTG
ncbi:MAG TPA: four-carbon acid sugar kinase family protein, partial [Bacillales bacterium]|nr:four-carbon acid sugar kinase family protein [Bacillales bacterium]